MMSDLFPDVYLVSDNLETASLDEVAAIETQLGISFPPGYAEYVTTLGLGTYRGYVRVYMPSRINDELNEFRVRWNEYYFWDKGSDVLEKQRVLESVIFADTIDGDEFIFHPTNPNKLYALPRHDDMIYEVGSSLDAMLHWLFEISGWVLPTQIKYFYPWKDRAEHKFARIGSDLSFEDLRNQLLALGIHTHAQVDPNERYLQLFVKEFGGDAHCYLDRAESMSNRIPLWRVHLKFDAASKDNPALKVITDFLGTLNFKFYDLAGLRKFTSL